MGIRFRCHQCSHELHVKDFQGGKRSRCPECETRFRIPLESSDYSIPLENPLGEDSQRSVAGVSSSTQLTNPQLATPQLSGSQLSGAQLASRQAAARNVVSNSSTLPSSPPRTSSAPAAHADLQPPDSEAEAYGDVPTNSLQEFDSMVESAAPSQDQAQTHTQPQAVREAPSATWYVRPPAGGQYGPAPANIFCEWLTENRVTRDSLVWRDGWPQWLVAGEVFVDYFGPAAPPSSIPTYATAPSPTSSQIASVQNESAIAPSLDQPASPGFVAPTSLSDRALAARKRQRKKNYLIMIGVLAAISIGLVIALVVVLMRNA